MGMTASQKPRVLELLRTVELGPYEIANAAPMHFVVKIYKHVEKPRTFLPIVFRRDIYRLKPSFATGVADETVEVTDDNYLSENFVRASAAAALKAIVEKIRTDYEPDFRKARQRSAR